MNGLHKLCKWIEDRGLKRAAVGNAPRANAELMISMLGLTDFFQLVVLGCECDRAKPFPDPYLKAIKDLQVSPGHTFVFEVCLPTWSVIIEHYVNVLGSLHSSQLFVHFPFGRILHQG